ncbi:hypothetical protein GCM10010327_37450 [Streptomyces nitrosporeus]|nr:hypothetical protein GCM10010327_37450 [Streptomyces nitrosporeus]
MSGRPVSTAITSGTDSRPAGRLQGCAEEVAVRPSYDPPPAGAFGRLEDPPVEACPGTLEPDSAGAVTGTQSPRRTASRRFTVAAVPAVCAGLRVISK